MGNPSWNMAFHWNHTISRGSISPSILDWETLGLYRLSMNGSLRSQKTIFVPANENQISISGQFTLIRHVQAQQCSPVNSQIRSIATLKSFLLPSNVSFCMELLEFSSMDLSTDASEKWINKKTETLRWLHKKEKFREYIMKGELSWIVGPGHIWVWREPSIPNIRVRHLEAQRTA